MNELPTHWLSLIAVVFLLGLKHGLDPDHLAAIDGLTRFNAQRRPRLSRWSGLLFSAGHGVVVTSVAILVATVATEWHAPQWLEHAGAWISIAFLALLGVANLSAVARTPRGEVVKAAGVRGRLFERLTRAEHPVLVAAVGATFAISFDTISQAVLFSIGSISRAGSSRPAGPHLHRRDDGHRCVERLVGGPPGALGRPRGGRRQRDEPCDRLHVARDRRARRGAPVVPSLDKPRGLGRRAQRRVIVGWRAPMPPPCAWRCARRQ
jgi:hypothetical protein